MLMYNQEYDFSNTQLGKKLRFFQFLVFVFCILYLFIFFLFWGVVVEQRLWLNVGSFSWPFISLSLCVWFKQDCCLFFFYSLPLSLDFVSQVGPKPHKVLANNDKLLGIQTTTMSS